MFEKTEGKKQPRPEAARQGLLALPEDAPTPDIDDDRVTEQGAQHHEVNDDDGYGCVWKKTVHLGALARGRCLAGRARRGSFASKFFI